MLMLLCSNVFDSDWKGKSAVLSDGYSERGLNGLAVIDVDESVAVVVENCLHVQLLYKHSIHPF